MNIQLFPLYLLPSSPRADCCGWERWCVNIDQFLFANLTIIFYAQYPEVGWFISLFTFFAGTTRWFTIAETGNGNSSFLWQSCGLPGVAKLQIFISFISKVFLKCLEKLKLLVVVYFKSSKFRAISTKIPMELRTFELMICFQGCCMKERRAKLTAFCRQLTLFWDSLTLQSVLFL